MNPSIQRIKGPRVYLTELVKDLSIEQLNKVPTGFNNNIIWNMGHIVASLQGICYARAGIEKRVPAEFYERYKGGSKPGDFAGSDEAAEIRALLISTVDRLEEDYNANLFADYNAWETRYGVGISNIDVAIGFLPFHEGLHIGAVLHLRRLV